MVNRDAQSEAEEQNDDEYEHAEGKRDQGKGEPVDPRVTVVDMPFMLCIYAAEWLVHPDTPCNVIRVR